MRYGSASPGVVVQDREGGRLADGSEDKEGEERDQTVDRVGEVVDDKDAQEPKGDEVAGEDGVERVERVERVQRTDRVAVSTLDKEEDAGMGAS